MYINAKGVELRESAASTNEPALIAGQLLRRGTANNDIFHGTAGQTLEGLGGDDWYNLWSSSWTVVEQAGGGIDTIIANFWGHITLPDQVENLVLKSPGSTSGTGNALNNIIIAGTVAATLNGGAGDDVLVGGAGADLFVITAGNGSDAIEGFKPGHDAIRLQGYGISTMAQLQSVAAQVGDDVRLSFANGEILVLRDVSLSALKPYDFGFLATLQTPGAGQSLLSYAGNVGIANGWYALNNVWGQGSLVERTDFVLTGVYDKSNMSVGTTFTWSFPFTTDLYPVVRAYPEIFFGVPPYGAHESNPNDKGLVFPIKVADLQSVTMTHDVTYGGQSAGFNVAYDIWFTSVPNGDETKISTELMIWLHAGSTKPFGDVVGSINAGGLSGKVYHSGTYTAVVADSDMPAGTLDLTAIIKALQVMGIISETEYLAAIELGSEVFFGSGSLKFNNLEFTVQAAAVGGSTVKHVDGTGAHVEMRTGLSNYTATAEVQDVTYTGSASATLRGNSRANTVIGGDKDDMLNLSDGGIDRAYGGAGDDGIYFGKAFTVEDYVDGGAGSNDQLGLQGNYALTLGANSLIGIETLALLSGKETRFGDTSGASYSYSIKTIDANVAAGDTLIVSAVSLRADEKLTFDGSAERDGSFTVFAGAGIDTLIGGAKNDGFWFGEGRFAASDRIDGGGGTDNQVGLSGRYGTQLVFAADTIKNIQTLALLSGADPRYGNGQMTTEYNIALHDGNLAAGSTLTVTGTALRADETMIIDGSAERDGVLRLYGGAGRDTLIGGAGNDLIVGAGGADRLSGGGGSDVFLYSRTSDSTTQAQDHILDFASGDLIDLSRIDAIAGTAVNDNFTIIGDSVFSGVAGQLRVSQVAGNWLIEGDVDGDKVADLSILVFTNAGYELKVADIII